MAESKKTSGGSKKNKELADQLRLAAELLDGAQEQPTKAAPAKKPAAKKTSGSSSGAKKPSAKKPAAKSAAGKSTATKSATAKKKTTPAEQPAEEPVAPTVEEPTPAPAQVEQPVVEQQTAKMLKCANCGTEFPDGTRFCMNCGQKLEEPVLAPAEEPAPAPVAEEPVAATEQPVQEQSPVRESATEQPAPAKEPAAKGNKVDAFAQKSSSIINKIKLPLFIVANVLLLLSSVFIIIGAFGFPYVNEAGQADKFTCSLFQYFGNSSLIISWMHGTAGTWAKGGYVMVGILMWCAFLLPLALIVKNITLFILKKNIEVHMLDAIITVAFLIAYLGIINMYGANMTWGHILALILGLVLLCYTVFVLLIENRNGPFPFFSLANMVLILLCMFLLTSNKVYNEKGWYAAAAASQSGGGGFAFIMLLVALAALVLLFIMQVRKLPAKIEYLLQFIVPAVAGGCALVALISYAGGKPDGLGMGGGFVFGAILTLLFAAADIVFAVVPQLHKFNVKVTDRMPKAQQTAEQAATTVPAEPTEQTETQTEQAEPPAREQPVKEQPDTSKQTVKCKSCGTENAVGEVFCKRCGRKLK